MDDLIYLTGDTHGGFDNIIKFCNRNKTTIDDIMIILGDVGLNYYLNSADYINKTKLSELPITCICVHGNHEQRPQNIESYKTSENEFGKFCYEEEFPNILFCIDAEVYMFSKKTFLCLGGAYSVDKYYRLQNGYAWFKDEQMNEDTKRYVKHKMFGRKFDYIISHTCPYKYIPREMFLGQVDQSMVDDSMEYFLDEVEENIEYGAWFCGHYHTNKSIGKMKFMYKDIIELI